MKTTSSHYQDAGYLDDVFGSDKEPPAQPAKKLVYPLVFDDELDSIDEPGWLVTGVLPSRSLCVVHGQPGAGKTFLVLDWALSVAEGFAWHGRDTLKGPVVYVLAEGWHGINGRVDAWKQHNEVLSDDRSGVAFLGKPIRLLDPRDVLAFGDSIEALGVSPVLVVLDTLARNAVGMDENSAREMGQVVSSCDVLRERFGCTVLLVHHSTKGGMSAPSLRGSSALKGAADTVVVVKEDAEAPGVVLVVAEKQKDSAPFQPMRFNLIPSSRSAVLVPEGQDPRQPKQGELEWPG